MKLEHATSVVKIGSEQNPEPLGASASPATLAAYFEPARQRINVDVTWRALQ